MEQYRGTTILSVRRGNEVALGKIVLKSTARKVRRL